MLDGIAIVNPGDIEKRSFEMITEILGEKKFPPFHENIIKRVIHATADFEFAESMKISETAVAKAFEAIKSGCNIVTDTKMASVGINRKSIARFGGQIVCYMDDEAVALEAKQRNVTRASVCMEKAAKDENNKIFALGNAPTALIRLVELIKEGAVAPALVIGVPVGFVNVVESKELLKTAGVPYILSEGRKGGSNIAAAIVNAILQMIEDPR
ncbi:Cobalt-precorrin-8X methylmutase [Sporotomaculum syntrophicum]|uniref:Cobalt-precorrin-8X methylmutase n=1 Tax=Sporotomaculum syntrophicum TaxID=182264 RepID=A0A9D2WP05_9FIRM|nr:precorrin-8X methylmutase [Sporotomaculum syntrophicum]KAF1084500.1 Cobalt-precorrin-8X methylmutase [Sporotomaculum syntrophicum]